MINEVSNLSYKVEIFIQKWKKKFYLHMYIILIMAKRLCDIRYKVYIFLYHYVFF